MGALCTCPRGEALSSITAYTCPESFGQIQKVAFQRLKKSDGSRNSFLATGAGDIKLKASWTSKLSAADDTKIVVPPYIQGVEVEPGAAITFGGGNDTLGGIEIIQGSEATAFTANFYKIPQSIIKQIKELQCEDLGVFLFNADGAICAMGDGLSTIVNYYPIPVFGLFVGDKKFGGLSDPDSNAIQWKFAPNWSDNIGFVKPTDFNPLVDLG